MVYLLERTAPVRRRYNIKRMDPKKHVFLLTPTDSDSGDATFVAKVVATPYPEPLHDELSSKGLAPRLIEPVQKHPGGMTLGYLRRCFHPFCGSKHENVQHIGKICVVCGVWWLLLDATVAASSKVVSFCMSIGLSLCLLSVFAHPNCLRSATLSGFTTLCAMLAKPDACQRSELSKCTLYMMRIYGLVYEAPSPTTCRCERDQDGVPGPCRRLGVPAFLQRRLGAAGAACQGFSGRPPQVPGLVCGAWRPQRRQCPRQVWPGEAAAPACLGSCTETAAARELLMDALLGCNLVGCTDTGGALIRTSEDRL